MNCRIAVFVPNWVGDAVMATPTLRALRKHYGEDATIVGVMQPVIAEVLQGTPWLNQVWLYSRDATDWSLRPLSLLLRMLRTRFDLSIHLTNDFLSVLMSRLGGTRRCAGYDRYRRGWMLHTRLEAPHDGKRFLPIAALDYYLRLAYALGCPPETPLMEVATSAADESAADRAWRNLGLGERDAVVMLNSSGAFGTAKLWPDESFAALAVRVADRLRHAVVVLCGPAERERAARIAALAAHARVFSLAAEPLSVGLTKACIRRCRCLVSTDSGPRHLGAALGVPVVALFGPTDMAWTDTHYPREIRLQRQVDCGPCGQRECPQGHHKCMRDLSVAEAFDAVAASLGSVEIHA